MVLNLADDSIMTYTISPETFMLTLQGHSYGSRRIMVFYQSLQKIKDMCLNFAVKFF